MEEDSKYSVEEKDKMNEFVIKHKEDLYNSRWEEIKNKIKKEVNKSLGLTVSSCYLFYRLVDHCAVSKEMLDFVKKNLQKDLERKKKSRTYTDIVVVKAISSLLAYMFQDLLIADVEKRLQDDYVFGVEPEMLTR